MGLKMTGTRKLALTASSLVLLVAGTSAAAHVNWFVERESEPLANFDVSEPVFLTWLCIAFGMVLFSIWLDGKLPTLRVAQSKLRHDFMEILRVFTGMSFLLTAYEGSLVAPHKVADGSFGLALVIMQAVIGIMLIANRWIKVAALLMLVLHAGVIVKFGILPALEYAIIIGIAFFLLLNSIEDEARRDMLKPYSVRRAAHLDGCFPRGIGGGGKAGTIRIGAGFRRAIPVEFHAGARH